MSYQCEVEEQPGQSTLSIRARAAVQELGTLRGASDQAIGQDVAELGEEWAGSPFAAYHNDDMQHLDVEIGCPGNRELPGRTDVHAGELPGGRAGACLHVGPHSEIESCYEARFPGWRSRGSRPLERSSRCILTTRSRRRERICRRWRCSP